MATQNQDRLRSHFASVPATSHPSQWDSLWEAGTFIPWDRGYANPALIDLLSSQPPSSSQHPSSSTTTISGPPTSSSENPTPGSAAPSSSPGNTILPSPIRQDGTRRKVLVPGCGQGYDVALFAAHGYDAYGLEVSGHAVAVARKYVDGVKSEDGGEGKRDKGPLEGEYDAALERGKGWGEVKIVEGDYFEGAWVAEIGAEDGGFDVVYDNTFLCALPPTLRPKWASRTIRLLRKDPNSTLICLEFPTHKPASSGGPPWSLPPTVHAELLKRPGEDISCNEQGVVVATEREEAENALVRVAHYTPRRTHDVGVVKGVVRDCVSIWRHKNAAS